MKAFVTGATGFLGAHVARVLAEQGADLRLLVRPTSDLRNLEGLARRTALPATCASPASLEKAVPGCEVVFHVAADYRLWVRDPEQMYRSNVEGTRGCLRPRARRGVRRVVYTSSVATMGFTSNGRIADEEFAGHADGYDRPLQAIEIHGRAGRNRGRPEAARKW